MLISTVIRQPDVELMTCIFHSDKNNNMEEREFHGHRLSPLLSPSLQSWEHTHVSKLNVRAQIMHLSISRFGF
jgi:hypothetical protein